MGGSADKARGGGGVGVKGRECPTEAESAYGAAISLAVSAVGKDSRSFLQPVA